MTSFVQQRITAYENVIKSDIPAIMTPQITTILVSKLVSFYEGEQHIANGKANHEDLDPETIPEDLLSTNDVAKASSELKNVSVSVKKLASFYEKKVNLEDGSNSDDENERHQFVVKNGNVNARLPSRFMSRGNSLPAASFLLEEKSVTEIQANIEKLENSRTFHNNAPSSAKNGAPNLPKPRSPDSRRMKATSMVRRTMIRGLGLIKKLKPKTNKSIEQERPGNAEKEVGGSQTSHGVVNRKGLRNGTDSRNNQN